VPMIARDRQSKRLVLLLPRANSYYESVFEPYQTGCFMALKEVKEKFDGFIQIYTLLKYSSLSINKQLFGPFSWLIVISVMTMILACLLSLLFFAMHNLDSINLPAVVVLIIISMLIIFYLVGKIRTIRAREYMESVLVIIDKLFLNIFPMKNRDKAIAIYQVWEDGAKWYFLNRPYFMFCLLSLLSFILLVFLINIHFGLWY
jgi:hypothetical protein